jgi:iron(III) transport system permease protein
LLQLTVAAAIGIVVVWPMTATWLAATRSVSHLQTWLQATGHPGWAESFSGWPGSREELIAQGELLDPTSANLLDDASNAAVSRPLRLAGETIGLVLLTELFSLPIGLALAFLLFRTNLPFRRFLLALLAIGALVPLPLHATAWLGAMGNVGRMQALGSRPILVGRFGAAVIHAMAALPWVVLLIGVGLRSVEPELEESARLDLPAWRVAWSVTLRRAIGSITTAALAVAVLVAGDMTVTDLLQVRTYAEEAYLQYTLGQGPASASAVALPPLLILGGLIVLLAGGLARSEPSRWASAWLNGPRWDLGRLRLPLGNLLLIFLGNILALPLYSLIWRAGRVGGRARLGRPPEWSLAGLAGTMRQAAEECAEPLGTSLFWTALAALGVGAIAWGLAWLGRKRGAWQWVTLAILAILLATPGPVAGMALVLAYRPWSWIYDSPAILVLAFVLRTLPYAILILWPCLRILPDAFFEAASIDGLGPAGQAFRIGLPLTIRPLAAAVATSFVLGLGELPASNLVVPPGTLTIAELVWTLLHTGVESTLAGVALIMLMAVAIAALLAILTVRSSLVAARAWAAEESTNPSTRPQAA